MDEGRDIKPLREEKAFKRPRIRRRK